MVNATNIREKINTKVFDALGSTATLQLETSTLLDKWGDESATYGTATNIVVVPWYDLFSEKTYEAFGEPINGALDFAVRYDQSIDVDDKLTWNTKVYKVKSIQYYTLKDTLLVKAIRVTEVLTSSL